MSYLFKHNNKFNEDISNWNVSNVTDMESMFSDCKIFNKPLNKWDVSNVRNMRSTFFYCKNYNHPLNSWNVGNVTKMNFMFGGWSNNCNLHSTPAQVNRRRCQSRSTTRLCLGAMRFCFDFSSASLISCLQITTCCWARAVSSRGRRPRGRVQPRAPLHYKDCPQTRLCRAPR